MPSSRDRSLDGNDSLDGLAPPPRIRANCGKIQGVSSNVVNLNRFRKKKQREDRAKQAEINRVRHGRTQAEKDRERMDRERAARLIDGKRLERGPEEGPSDGVVRRERSDEV